MLVTTEIFNLSSIAYFVLDNVMFWEAFRWERLDMGHIYIQKFLNGKMYAGMTINLKRRMNNYKNLKGSNKHHTAALKKHIDTMQISFTQCPNYLLDAVEIFVIAFFDLTDRTKGYNKQAGGRSGVRMSKETLMNLTNAISDKLMGENHPMFGRTHTKEARIKMSLSHNGKTIPKETCMKMSLSRSGELHHNFGKTLPEVTRAKISLSLTGKTQTKETRVKRSLSSTGKKRSKEIRAKISGDRNPNSKPICVFGKLYGTVSMASDTLREVCDTNANGNFMKYWIQKPEHQYNIFYVTKEFYNNMKDSMEIITRDMYDNF
jgi:hypothetical protein